MGEQIDISLDEIIRSNSVETSYSYNERLKMFTKKNRNNKKLTASGMRSSGSGKFDLSEKLKSRQMQGDARTQIIVQQRAKIKDARDRLNHIAKQTDARQRLVKMKMQSAAGGERVAKFVGGMPNHLKRLGNNSQATKVLQTRTMVQIQRQLMENQPTNKNGRNKGFRNNTFQDALFTKKNFGSNNNMRGRIGQRGGIGGGVRLPVERKQVTMDANGMLITTTNNGRGRFRSSMVEQYKEPNSFDEECHVTRVNEEFEDVEMMDVRPSMRMRPSTQRFSAQPVVNRLSASLQSRLDMGGVMNQQQGVAVTVGNLHPAVTQDDILELFGDVGQLKRATLGHNGVAEVVFAHAADAQRACDTYHNRQLDGRPMSVKLNQGSPSTSMPFSSQNKQYLVSPDAQLIRKALFSATRGSSLVSQSPQFTIRMTRK